MAPARRLGVWRQGCKAWHAEAVWGAAYGCLDITVAGVIGVRMQLGYVPGAAGLELLHLATNLLSLSQSSYALLMNLGHGGAAMWEESVHVDVHVEGAQVAAWPVQVGVRWACGEICSSNSSTHFVVHFSLTLSLRL